jgi:hypothetical protein
MDGVTLYPYRLADLVDAQRRGEGVWIVEGEKDADRLHALGLIATCNAMGAGKWKPEYTRWFQGRTCYLIPDNDTAGKRHMQQVAASLAGAALVVKIVTLPDLLPKQDVCDWLDSDGTLDELGRLAYAAPVWERAPDGPAAAPEAGAEEGDRDATVADLRLLSQSAMSWVWPLWIPTGAITILAAEAGTGKTRLCFDLARRLFHNLLWPDGIPNEHPHGARTLWIAADNQWQEMEDIPAAFGIPDEAVVLNAPASDPRSGTSLETDEDLEARIVRVKPALVIIDTITNTTDLKAQDVADAKRQYKPLQEIAARTNVAIICVTHLNAGGRVLGRRAEEKARVVIQLACPDPDRQSDRLKLWVPKTWATRPPPLGVTMGAEGNDYDQTPPEPPGNHKRAAPLPARTLECMAWLEQRLGAGPARVSELRRELEQLGYGANTIYRAKDQLHLEETEDAGGRKWWAPPGPGNAQQSNGEAAF